MKSFLLASAIVGVTVGGFEVAQRHEVPRLTAGTFQQQPRVDCTLAEPYGRVGAMGSLTPQQRQEVLQRLDESGCARVIGTQSPPPRRAATFNERFSAVGNPAGRLPVKIERMAPPASPPVVPGIERLGYSWQHIFA